MLNLVWSNLKYAFLVSLKFKLLNSFFGRGSSYERSGLKLDRAMVANVVKLKLSRCDSAYVPHVFKFTFSRCGSRCVKFEVKFTNLAKFDFKFERKKLRRSIFSLDEADLNLRAGATLSVVTE